MSKLAGKIAVITGGNSGIGLATAQRFVQEGARVAILGRNAETLDRAVETLGADAIGVQGDVTDPAALRRVFEAAARWGQVDIVFANAGVAEFQPLADATEAHYDTVMDINVKGAFFTLQAALPHLSDGASLIITSSAVNVTGMPGSSVYAAGKAAVRSFARVFAAELAPRRIRVNTVSPGPVETPIFDRFGFDAETQAATEAALTAKTPLGRFGRSEEIANVVAFLASDEASYVTGSDFYADGGYAQV